MGCEELFRASVALECSPLLLLLLPLMTSDTFSISILIPFDAKIDSIENNDFILKR